VTCALLLYALAALLAVASIPSANGFPLLLGAGVLFMLATAVYEAEEAKRR
jgi:hypothetical protein